MKTNKDYLYLLEDSPEKFMNEISERVKNVIANEYVFPHRQKENITRELQEVDDILEGEMEEAVQLIQQQLWETGRIDRQFISNTVNNYLEKAEMMGLIYYSYIFIYEEEWGQYNISVDAIVGRGGPRLNYRFRI